MRGLTPQVRRAAIRFVTLWLTIEVMFGAFGPLLFSTLAESLVQGPFRRSTDHDAVHIAIDLLIISTALAASRLPDLLEQGPIEGAKRVLFLALTFVALLGTMFASQLQVADGAFVHARPVVTIAIIAIVATFLLGTWAQIERAKTEADERSARVRSIPAQAPLLVAVPPHTHETPSDPLPKLLVGAALGVVLGFGLARRRSGR